MNVLIVDDEIMAVNALQRRVNWQALGIEQVFGATSAEQARQALDRNHVDILLCDIEMPRESGLELYRWVNKRYPFIACIYITCHPNFEYAREALQLGSSDYLLKPINYTQLEEVLTRLIAQLREKRTAEEKAGYGELWLEEKIQDKVQPTEGDAVRMVKKYIKQNIERQITIAELGSQVHLNPQYLMRLFKKQTGMSVLEYITEIKMEMAQKLLKETNLSALSVSESLGYASYTYFLRSFKKATGLTPKEFRGQT